MNRNKKGQFVKGYQWTEELKKKLSLTTKGRKKKPLTEEHRKKLSESHKGIPSPLKGKKGIWKHTEEWKASARERMIERNLTENRSYTWKGDDVKYMGVHQWVRKWKGQPLVCEKCGKEMKSTRYIDWANKDHKYRRILDDYIRLCRKCHREYDKNNN